MRMKEIQIAVPWGFVAAKIWGNDANPPILVFHGILDNAGSFDRLIPLLNKEYRYICIDLPGHGKSTHFPPSTPIFTINNIIVYKIVAKYFDQKQYNIIGHSYGGQVALLFAQIYPELVNKLVLLDTVHLMPVSASNFSNYLREKFHIFLKMQEKLINNEPPSYTYEEAFQKTQEQRLGFISEAAAEALLNRNLIPSDTENGKFKFSFDQRLKNFLNPVHDMRYILNTFVKSPVKVPVLIILGKESKGQQLFFKQLMTFYKKQKNFTIKFVNGNHDVHNNDPEKVAPYINKFLLNMKNKL